MEGTSLCELCEHSIGISSRNNIKIVHLVCLVVNGRDYRLNTCLKFQFSSGVDSLKA